MTNANKPVPTFAAIPAEAYDNFQNPEAFILNEGRVHLLSTSEAEHTKSLALLGQEILRAITPATGKNSASLLWVPDYEAPNMKKGWTYGITNAFANKVDHLVEEGLIKIIPVASVPELPQALKTIAKGLAPVCK